MLRLLEEGSRSVRLPRALQRQDRPAQHRQRDHRRGQAVHRDRAVLGSRPGQACRDPGRSGARLSAAGRRHCAAPAGRRGAARGGARARRQSLQGSGVEPNPYFDFWKQTYLITMRWLDDVLQETEGLDERTRQRAEFYLKQLASALSPSNFPLTNPEVLRETLAHQRQEPRAGHGQSGARHGAVGRRVQHHPDRSRRVRGRPQRRHRARQGRVPERTAAAHPIRAHHREGARGAAADRAALDQQVLHPRPVAAEILHPLHGRARLHGVRRLVGQPRPAPRAQDLRRLHDRGHSGRHGCRQARDRLRPDQRDRLLRRRHPARHDAGLPGRARRGAVRIRHVLCRPGRLHQGRRPAAVHRRCPAQVAGRDDGRARLPRRLAHGHRVQHAAAEGPDLALHRQQLHAGQEAVPVRPAVLEPGLRRA